MLGTVLSGLALALAVAAIACSVLLPARLAQAVLARRSRRVIAEMQELIEDAEIRLAKLRQHVLEVLDATERKRKSVSASASKLKQYEEPDGPMSEKDVLAEIEQRIGGDGSWDS